MARLRRKPNGWLWSALGLLVLLAALTIFLAQDAAQTENQALDAPEIHDLEALRRALSREDRTYLFTGLPLTGTPAQDPFHLLRGEYLYIAYEKEKCEETTYTDQDGLTSSQLTWEAVPDQSRRSVSDQISLADCCPLQTRPEAFQRDFYLPLDETSCLPSAIPFLKNDDYYPYFPGDYEGNVRYRLHGAYKGETAVFLGRISNGQVIPQALNSGGTAVLLGGEADDLRYYLSEGQTGWTVMAWLLGFPLDVFLWIRAALNRRRAARDSRPA